MSNPANSLDITSAGLVNFDGVSTFSGVTVTQYDILAGDANNGIVSISPSSAGYVLTSNGTSATPSFQAGGGGGSVTIAGDSGSISGSSLTIYANQASANCGSSVSFSNSGTTSTLNLTDLSTNVCLGAGAGASISGGSGNTALGAGSLPSLTSGFCNIAIGCGNGLPAGGNYTNVENSNIVIGNEGVASESNVMRIGTTGAALGQVTTTYIAGIYGNSPVDANSPEVVLCDNVGNITSIGSNTSGYVLTSNGTASPSFQALPTFPVSYLTLVGQYNGTISNGPVSASIAVPNTYNNFLLVVDSLTQTSHVTSIFLQLSTNGGSTYISSGYESGVNSWVYNAATFTNTNSTSSFLINSLSSATGTYSGSAQFWLTNMTSGSGYVGLSGQSTNTTTGSPGQNLVYGNYTTASTVVNTIGIGIGGGPLASANGNFWLYGLTT